MRLRHKAAIYHLTAFATGVAIAISCTSMFDSGNFKLVSFSAPGCSHTKAPGDDYIVEKVQAGTLHLQSKNGNLKITLSGLSDSCAIKDGFDCQATLNGSYIYVNVVAKSESPADCICAVDDIVTELSGLEQDKYTLVYKYKSPDEDITQEVVFNFSSGLDMQVPFERSIMYQANS